MALRYQKGSLRIQKTKCGDVWVLRYFAIDPETGRKIEPTPLKVGTVRDFPSKAQAWAEVGRQDLHDQINTPTLTGAATFRQIAGHYSSRELTPNSMFEKGDGTTYCYQHIIAHYLNERWGEVSAISIKPTDVQAWLHSLSKDVKAEAGLDWPTLVKIRSVMNMVYCHAMREELIPAEIKYNPCRPHKTGRRKTAANEIELQSNPSHSGRGLRDPEPGTNP
jgi:hypothetical protein